MEQSVKDFLTKYIPRYWKLGRKWKLNMSSRRKEKMKIFYAKKLVYLFLNE